MGMETNILLESGTNELEIVEFHIGENSFGINVAKVKEIIRYTPITKVPLAPKGIKGIIKLREQVMSVVDLPSYLGMDSLENEADNLFIIAQFKNMFVEFYKAIFLVKTYCSRVFFPNAQPNIF